MYLQRSLDRGIIVDNCDLWLLALLPWCIKPKGYVECTFYCGLWRETVKLHHFIIGTPIYPYEIDHADRNKLNNRRNNLAVVTPYRNALNRDQVALARNVRFHKGRYEARIRREGITYYGYGDNDDAAIYEAKIKLERGYAPTRV